MLDLGCGAGIDTLLAARAVGPRGRAIGLDATPEMVDRTRRYADRMVAVFKDVRARHRVPAKQTQELLDIVASTKADIVVAPQVR